MDRKIKVIQEMILFIFVLFANIECIGFYIKPSSEHLIFDVVSSELYSIYFLFVKMKLKIKKAFNFLFQFVTFCFKTLRHN